jgi:hypothetical protein
MIDELRRASARERACSDDARATHQVATSHLGSIGIQIQIAKLALLKTILMAQIKPHHLSPEVYHRASSTAPSLIASPTKRRIIIHDTSESEQETIEGSKSTTTNAASHVIKTNGKEEDQRQTGQSAGELNKHHSTLLCLHHHRWQAIALSKIHQLHHYVTMILT